MMTLSVGNLKPIKRLIMCYASGLHSDLNSAKQFIEVIHDYVEITYTPEDSYVSLTLNPPGVFCSFLIY